MAAVYLHKKRKKRVEGSHPWIFDNEIERVEGEIHPGDVVDVYNHLGMFMATGYFNPESKIRVRIISYTPDTEMNKEFFVERFDQCKIYRNRFAKDASSCRMVYGEADFLPGLIVDKLENVLVVQILTLGMDLCRDEIVAALVEVFQPKGIYERSDVPVRELEGLEQRTGVLYGKCPTIITIQENGIHMEVDIEQGQKTGYFFDQTENRAAIAPLMQGWGYRSGIKLQTMSEDGVEMTVPVNQSGKVVAFPYWDGATVLECFAHTGSFTVHACHYGAKKVTCLDVSEHAIETAKRNVALNGFEDRVEFVVANAFDYLREQVAALTERKERAQAAEKKIDTSKTLSTNARTWDVVILDPPAFAKTRGAVKGAIRGYKDINLHGLKLVNEGGYLVTASCSFHVDAALFLETIQAAALDAKKILRLVEFRNTGKDHPHILGVDEGNYLKFAIFEVKSMS